MRSPHEQHRRALSEIQTVGSVDALSAGLDDRTNGPQERLAGRPVTERGVPKIVELNIDGAVGGTGHVDFLTERFLDFYRQTGIAASYGLHAPPPAVDTRLVIRMQRVNRRRFLQLAGGSVATTMLSDSIARAMHPRTGSAAGYGPAMPPK